MSNSEQHGLRRIDNTNLPLPPGFDRLPKTDQAAILKRLAEKHVEDQAELMRKVGQSKVSENDMAVVMENVNTLDQEKKFYSVREKVKMGASDVDITIRGGDTKFIVPILVAIGIIIFTIAALLGFRH